MDIQLTYEEGCTIYASLNLARKMISQWIYEPGVDSDEALLNAELDIIQIIIDKMDKIWE